MAYGGVDKLEALLIHNVVSSFILHVTSCCIISGAWCSRGRGIISLVFRLPFSVFGASWITSSSCIHASLHETAGYANFCLEASSRIGAHRLWSVSLEKVMGLLPAPLTALFLSQFVSSALTRTSLCVCTALSQPGGAAWAADFGARTAAATVCQGRHSVG